MLLSGYDVEKKGLTDKIHELEKLQKDWSSKEQSLTVEKLQLKSELEDLKQITEDINQEEEVNTDLYFNVKGLPFKKVKVVGGTFMLGATNKQVTDAHDDEKPQHNVTLSNYFIGEVPVTQKLWQKVMGKFSSFFKDADNPVENVSWYDCNDFIKKLNALTKNERPIGLEFRLPTEAEWEYAARGGLEFCNDDYKYSGGNSLGVVAWFGDNSLSRIQPIGKKEPNQLGIYDMSGNVWEWCYDGMRTYDSKKQTNPVGPLDSTHRVLRGGSWCSVADNCRVSRRFINSPSFGYDSFGLRLCLGRVL